MEIYAETAMSILDELHTERLDYHSEYLPLADAINQLSDYEETRLEPKELAQAAKEGRLVVLPCKTGANVWFIKSAFSIAQFPIKAKHVSIRGISCDGDVYYSAITEYNGISRSFYGSDIGKTVFLTREAAEAALEEREEEHESNV